MKLRTIFKSALAAGYSVFGFSVVKHHGLKAGVSAAIFAFIVSYAWFAYMENKMDGLTGRAWFVFGAIGSISLPFAWHYLGIPYKEFIVISSTCVMSVWMLWCNFDRSKRSSRAKDCQAIIDAKNN